MFKIPIYKALITEEYEGMAVISLVDYPAVESDWVAFNKHEEKVQFKVEDEEKKVILGVVMRANFPIFRRTETGFEYYIEFDADTIRQMARKYLKDGFQNNISIMHNGELIKDGVYREEFFIKDDEMGISPKGFDDIENGSLFARFKIDNDNIWNDIKEGKFKGFSLEGLFEVQETEEEQEYREIVDLINKIKNKLHTK